MRCCLPNTIQPPLTIKHKSTGKSFRMDGAAVEGIRDADHDLEQEDRLHLRESLQRDSAPQRQK